MNWKRFVSNYRWQIARWIKGHEKKNRRRVLANARAEFPVCFVAPKYVREI